MEEDFIKQLDLTEKDVELTKYLYEEHLAKSLKKNLN